MTDAALAVTQSAVEAVTERYIESLGGAVEKRETRWEVTIPDDADTELPAGSLSVRCGNDLEADAAGASLHPESEFFQRLLGDASERCPTGKLSMATDQAEVAVPQWLHGNDVEVRRARFTPYYDRSAVVVLFTVSVETVSEYQREFLRACAIDRRSENRLPALEAAFLRTTSVTTETTERTSRSSLTESEARSLLDTARDQLLETVQTEIDDVHRKASSAADAELEEYRRLQQQRIRELETERSKLSSKVDELSETINDGDQKSHVEALQERKEVNTETERVTSELRDLRERRDHGFPHKQGEIRDRHALDVRVNPLTITEVEYERGELDVELTHDGVTRTVTVGYGSGIGITDDRRCSSCDRVFSAENPVTTIKNSLRCRRCTSSTG
ncbi:hypothetical protein SAMN05192561_101821 [Halopenitus malekzadehii]|uniref:Uncharacterized protein n=1 Tax=Halopenitus malekzadehii TaxID=1267564 RepID=A0A1H6I5R8_9EURY|nr:hypothetical protein [Halopenitus malekzadehii]SEH41741.1 hypothetical protein SAMN05192561_101821 [Halopenitus malekzadehii]